MKKTISLILALMLCVSIAVPAFAADSDRVSSDEVLAYTTAAPQAITVTVDGQAVVWTDAAPFIDKNNRTMVPLRAVADAMGLTVDWDGGAREAVFSDASKTIYFPINSSAARTGDGGKVKMDTAAVIVKDRTYAPIRYLAEYFGYEVGWDGATKTVSLRIDPDAGSKQPETPAVPTEAEAYARMITLRDEYPEGLHWTNDNFYAWNGGIFSGGYGCAGFAFLLSDAAFGDLPARQVKASFDTVRVGDILRINNDTHSVIVLEVKAGSVVIAEGNYNDSVHWGRTLTATQVNNATYMMTRYPA